MSNIVLLKLILFSTAWTMGNLIYNIAKAPEPTGKRLLFTFWPWLILLSDVLLFWWG